MATADRQVRPRTYGVGRGGTTPSCCRCVAQPAALAEAWMARNPARQVPELLSAYHSGRLLQVLDDCPPAAAAHLSSSSSQEGRSTPSRGRTGKERYQSYLNAYKTQHGGPHGSCRQGCACQPALRRTDLRVACCAASSLRRPQQMEARANRMANQGITAQQKIIREEAKLMRDEALRADGGAGRCRSRRRRSERGAVRDGRRRVQRRRRRRSRTWARTSRRPGGARRPRADVPPRTQDSAAVGAPGLAVGGPAGRTPGSPGRRRQASRRTVAASFPAQAITAAGGAAQFGLAGMVSAQNLRATQEAQAGYRSRWARLSRARVGAQGAGGRAPRAGGAVPALSFEERGQRAQHRDEPARRPPDIRPPEPGERAGRRTLLVTTARLRLPRPPGSQAEPRQRGEAAALSGARDR